MNKYGFRDKDIKFLINQCSDLRKENNELKQIISILRLDILEYNKQLLEIKE